MAEDCIFCQIVAGKVPADVIYRDDEILAFHDISPMAPVHVLVIPRRHIGALSDTTEADTPMLGRLVNVTNHVARDEGISGRGYRVAINSGVEGGQTVDHLHLHLLGGRQLDGQLG